MGNYFRKLFCGWQLIRVLPLQWAAFCVIALCGGCASSSGTVQDAHKLSVLRAEIAQINRDLADLTQVFIYTGRICPGPIGEQALDAALQIVGAPSDEERLLAQQMTAEDLRTRTDRSLELLRQKELLTKELDKTCLRLGTEVPQLYASYATLKTLSRLAIIGGSVLLIGIFLLRR
ncbi:MAG: hypothetical protein LBC42_01890 [Puniceicoccales bacterium]|nr:hypothetical protein [Puniceicoccales bacterium]